MRNLRKHVAAIITVAAVLALAACGSSTTPGTTTSASKSGGASSAALTKVTVGASPVPHAKILEFVQKNLAPKAGLDIKIVEFDDYVQPNEALASGQLDANYFQHLPYLNAQIKDRGYKFEAGKGIHLEPYAAFSKKFKTVAEVTDGASIAITNDVANQIRGLRLLAAAGLLKDITDNSSAVSLTAAQNPKGLKFLENQPEVIVQQLNDPKVDIAFVNGNFILTAGLKADNALLVEKVEGNPNSNILVWRTDNKNPGVATLETLLHSKEVAEFIKQSWPSGDVIPGA